MRKFWIKITQAFLSLAGCILLSCSVDYAPREDVVDFVKAGLNEIRLSSYTVTIDPADANVEGLAHAVPGYVNQFRLYQGLSKKPLLERSELTGTSVVLDDLTVLDRGNLFWEVRALRKNSGGKTERDGLVARQRFTIDLPKLTAPDAAGRKEYYGN